MRARLLLALSYTLFAGGLITLLLLSATLYFGYGVFSRALYALSSLTLFALSYYFYRLARKHDDLLRFFGTAVAEAFPTRFSSLSTSMILFSIIFVASAPLLYTQYGVGASFLSLLLGAFAGALGVAGYVYEFKHA